MIPSRPFQHDFDELGGTQTLIDSPSLREQALFSGTTKDRTQ